MKLKKVLAIFLSAIFFLLPLGCSKVSYTTFNTQVFSSSLPFATFMIGKNKDTAYEEMITMFDELNNQININDQSINSQILQLNRAQKNEIIEIGHHSYTIINIAKQIYLKTQGAFNIASYPLSYLWATDTLSLQYYNGEFSTRPTPPSFINSSIPKTDKPTSEQIETVKQYCNLDYLTVYEQEGQYFATKQIDELMIDLGAIAKGYAVDLCVEICKKYQIESALINLAGNLYVYNDYYEDKKSEFWDIYIGNPSVFSIGSICAISVKKDLSVVTSGDYMRFRLGQNSPLDTQYFSASHIMDSNKGIPYNLYESEGDYFDLSDRIISVTIINESSALADSYATATAVMGLSKAYQFLTENNLKAIIFTADKKYSIIGEIELIKTDQYNGYQDYQLYQGL